LQTISVNFGDPISLHQNGRKQNNDQSVNIDDELSQSEPAENILQNCSQVEPQQ
jgi:hypothetical protein